MLPIMIENLGLFCFKNGKLGHEQSKCFIGHVCNPRIVDGAQRRRYSAALKGVTPRNKIPIPLHLKEKLVTSDMKIDEINPLSLKITEDIDQKGKEVEQVMVNIDYRGKNNVSAISLNLDMDIHFLSSLSRVG